LFFVSIILNIQKNILIKGFLCILVDFLYKGAGAMLKKQDFFAFEDKDFKLYDFNSFQGENLLHFTYKKNNEQDVIITFHFTYLDNELKINFRTTYLSDETIMKASEKAHQIRKSLLEHPQFRIRVLTDHYQITFGDFLIKDINRFNENCKSDNFDEFITAFNQIYQESVSKVKSHNSIPIFDLVLIGREGYLVAKILRDLEIADFKMNKHGIVKVNFGMKNGDKFFMESFNNGLNYLGFSSWIHYSWNKIEVPKY
jgi:hypothetical protein